MQTLLQKLGWTGKLSLGRNMADYTPPGIVSQFLHLNFHTWAINNGTFLSVSLKYILINSLCICDHYYLIFIYSFTTCPFWAQAYNDWIIFSYLYQ